MKNLILLIVLTSQSILCLSQIQSDSCRYLSEQKVDSLFKIHIDSFKSKIIDHVVVKEAASNDDVLFLDFFYYLSGMQVTERDYSYAPLPVYVKCGEVKEIENWYNLHKKDITWSTVVQIYNLIEKMKSVQADDIDKLELEYKKIDDKLNSLRIK